MHVGPRDPVAVNDATLVEHIERLRTMEPRIAREHLLWQYETILRSIINGTESNNPIHVKIALRMAKEWIAAAEITFETIVREAENALDRSDDSAGEDA